MMNEASSEPTEFVDVKFESCWNKEINQKSLLEILGGKNRQNEEHTIRKVNFWSKNSILTKPQHFHEFFTQKFFDIFSREINVVNS